MEKYQLNDVYGISRDIPLNYVSRDTVDEKFKNKKVCYMKKEGIREERADTDVLFLTLVS